MLTFYLIGQIMQLRKSQITSEKKVFIPQEITYNLFDFLIVLIVLTMKTINRPIDHVDADGVVSFLEMCLSVRKIGKIKTTYIQTI